MQPIGAGLSDDSMMACFLRSQLGIHTREYSVPARTRAAGSEPAFVLQDERNILRLQVMYDRGSVEECKQWQR